MSDIPGLHNTLSRQRVPGRDELTVLLYDRLLWLRNQYDFGKPVNKPRVLHDINAVLHYAEGVAQAAAKE